MTEPAPRVVIADDQALVRTGFGMILAADGIDVVAEAADGDQAVEAVCRTRPDLVLMDIRMPGTDGLEATRLILSGALLPDPPRVIMLTTFDLDRYVYAALTAGASGFLLKDVTPEHLVAAVRLARTGDALLAPAITRRLVERFVAREAPASSPAPGPGGAHPPRARSAPLPRLRPEQRRTRRALPAERGHREDPCGAHPRQAPPAGPRPGRRRRLRDRSDHPGRAARRPPGPA